MLLLWLFVGGDDGPIPSEVKKSTLDLFQGGKGSSPTLVTTKSETHVGYNYEHSVTL